MKPFTFDRTVRLVLTIAVIICLFLLTRQLSSVLLPFVVAWFLAYLINPIVNFFQFKCRLKNRTFSVIVTLIVLLGTISGIIALLVPLVSSEVSKMSGLISNYINGINAETFLPAAIQEELRQWLQKVDWQNFLANANISGFIDKVSPYIGGVVGGSIDAIVGLFVIFVCFLYLVFILVDYDNISDGAIEILPPRYRELVSGIVTDLQQGMNKYFRGQALVALCVGVLFSIGFLIMGLPLAVVVGLFIGLLNMVPYLQTAGIPVCMLLGLLQSAATGTSYWIILLEIAVVFVVVQSIQDMVLTPLIMGNVTGMNPAVMLLSLSIWGSLLGVAGMIIALPVTTVLISYYKRFVINSPDFQVEVSAPTEATAAEVVTTEEVTPAEE